MLSVFRLNQICSHHNLQLIRHGNIRAYQLCFSTKTKGKSPSTLSLCQVNNHPNYRLKQAKDRLAADVTRRNRQIKHKQMFTSPKVQKAPPLLKYRKTVQEQGILLQTNENPVIRNDGTSSGAVLAEKLRLARRKVIEKLARPIDRAATSDYNTKTANASPGDVKEHGLDLVINENPVKLNDGTSSGAIAAERLREKRRQVLESMRQASGAKRSSGKTDTANVVVSTQIKVREKSVKEHGLDIYVNSNPVRINDGTSSGAIVAQRLKEKRRKILEKMMKS